MLAVVRLSPSGARVIDLLLEQPSCSQASARGHREERRIGPLLAIVSSAAVAVVVVVVVATVHRALRALRDEEQAVRALRPAACAPHPRVVFVREHV